MGKSDIYMKRWLSDKSRFADLIMVLCFRENRSFRLIT